MVFGNIKEEEVLNCMDFNSVKALADPVSKDLSWIPECFRLIE